MIHDLKPYPTYKNSGVPWLGEVPEHWEILRLRNAVDMRVSNVDKHTKEGELSVRLCNYVDVYKNDRITDHIKFMGATATPEEIARFRLELGDVLITKDSEAWNDIGIPALVEYSAPDLICGYHLALLRPRNRLLSGAYLMRALQSPDVAYQFHVSANGVTRYSLSQDAIKSALFPLPSLTEQYAIVRFLDNVERRIRRYICSKRRLIELLNEQKQAIIQRAVTRGLGPNVRLKPSEIDWLGYVPEHWDIRKLKWLAVFNPSKSEAENALKANEMVVFLPMERVSTDGRIDCTDLRPITDVWHGYTYFRRHDVVIAKITPCFENSKGAYLGLLLTEFGFGSTEFIVLRAKQGIDPEYLYLLTSLKTFRVLGAEAMTGAAGQQRVPVDFIRSFRVPLPPLDEQRDIVSKISAEVLALEQAIYRIRREIDLIREYRTRLISDVVTGKLDVRGVDLPAPDWAEAGEDRDENIDDGLEEITDTGEAVLDADN